MTVMNGYLYGANGLVEDVLRVIYSYCDIPSLYSLSRTCSDGYEQIMSNDFEWKRLTNLRFPTTTHGSSKHWMTWREKFHQWNICQRPPMPIRRSTMKVIDGHIHHGLALWMTISHTDDCQTKYLSNSIRCIEFKLILQLVQSRRQPCTILYHDIHLMMQNELCQRYLIPTISKQSISKLNIPLSTTRGKRRDIPTKFESTILYHSEQGINDTTSFVLKPFQVAVLSIHVPTTAWMETDFLAQALEIQIPFSSNNNNNKSIIQRYTAPIISESNMWEYYQELPGGCLSLLSSSNSMVHV